jgi:hypothetical protein
VAFHPLRLTPNFVTSRPAGRRIKRGPTTPLRQRLPSLTSQWFGLFPFRSPLLRESRFLSFPPGTKMFQFPGLPFPAYGFSWEHARITTRGFPHSEIAGSKVGQHLPRAYRSRPRPSSALGAKASTVRSCSLDRKEHIYVPLWSFQGAHRQTRGRSLKTQQRVKRRGRRSSRRAGCPDEREALSSTGRQPPE